ncbi:hypothetical protein COMA2_60042 [Candidatus Nitrospira nitrificans]|uniref:Uncharacterized protein n=1 Tax=Candidatus Nitrospira nitrificans TaxID=1742973 RepID=A0A0S4LQL4_9BACT|nr:hypothetical protein COMA2_60042 [Candidatus Nitrospira nitrificans]
MNDPLKLTPFSGKMEYERAERWAVDRPIRIEDSRAECADNISPRRFVRLDNLSRQLIGIDHDGAASPEHFRNRAFPGRHATSQTDKYHGGGAYHALCRTTKGD